MGERGQGEDGKEWDGRRVLTLVGDQVRGVRHPYDDPLPRLDGPVSNVVEHRALARAGGAIDQETGRVDGRLTPLL